MTSSERHHRAKEILLAAVELEPAARQAFLSHACAGDLELLEDVQALLGFEAEASTLLERPAVVDAGLVVPDLRHDGPTANGMPRLGPYELHDRIGEGSMGEVYRAVRIPEGQVVALKILCPPATRSTRAVARFQREMAAVARLDHPNIVEATDSSQADGTHYLAMELVDGLSLDRLVDRPGPLPVADACDLVRQAALGLQHAHEAGLVHRDVKPSNLMLSTAGRVKVLDLGLARLLGDRCGATLTLTNEVMGTPAFMAPEQAADPRLVDIRADLYSLGCVLFFLLAGHSPFFGPEYRRVVDQLAAHAEAPVPPIRQLRPEVPRGLEEILDRLLAKRAADRFATPADVALALEPWAAGSDLVRLLSDARSRSRPRHP